MTFGFVCVNSNITVLQPDEQVISPQNPVKKEKKLNEIPHLFRHWTTMKKFEKNIKIFRQIPGRFTEFTLICTLIYISYERTSDTLSIKRK